VVSPDTLSVVAKTSTGYPLLGALPGIVQSKVAVLIPYVTVRGVHPRCTTHRHANPHKHHMLFFRSSIWSSTRVHLVELERTLDLYAPLQSFHGPPHRILPSSCDALHHARTTHAVNISSPPRINTQPSLHEN
jgi:hypothetical protein